MSLVCLSLLAVFSSLAQGGELGDRYAAFLDARVALLDSMEYAIAPLDAEDLRFVSDTDQESHEAWLQRTRRTIGQLREDAADWHAQPTLENALRFEFRWDHVRASWPEALRLASALSAIVQREFAGLEEATGREEALAILERSDANRRALSSTLKRWTELNSALMDIDMEYLSVRQRYIGAASDELERVGWTP